MHSTEIFERREPNVRSYCRSLAAVLTGARGSLVWDTERRKYIDFLSGPGEHPGTFRGNARAFVTSTGTLRG